MRGVRTPLALSTLFAGEPPAQEQKPETGKRSPDIGALKAAFSMFTIVPIDVEGEDVMHLSKRFWMVVFVGAFLGLVAGLVMYLLTDPIGPFTGLVSAVIVVFILFSFNRFLHLDGLSDFGDGMLAMGDMERKIVIMKDSHVGAGGLGYAVIFTLLSVAALSSLPYYVQYLLFLAPFVAEVCCKCTMVSCAALGESREGLGGIFVKNTNGQSAMIAALLALILSLGVMALFKPEELDYLEVIVLAITAVLASIIVGAVMARVAMKNFGCVNGDVLGAANEVARPIILLAITAAIWFMMSPPW
jgi:adenosylcobinamide-GDP ribazoletransferase